MGAIAPIAPWSRRLWRTVNVIVEIGMPKYRVARVDHI